MLFRGMIQYVPLIRQKILFPMAKQGLTLESLERIISVTGRHQLAEASLAALREVAAGDHFSAILLNRQDHKVEDYLLNQNWLSSNGLAWNAARHGLTDHPLAKIVLSQQRSMALVRSSVVADSAWRKTWIYNEVERPMGVEEIASVCQITASNQLLILTCGRSRGFSDGEFASIQSFQRVLSGLVASRVASPQLQRSQLGETTALVAKNRLYTLTRREYEILQWVREGKRDPEIGTILGISFRTVNHHLASIYRKLNVETRTAAAVFQ